LQASLVKNFMFMTKATKSRIQTKLIVLVLLLAALPLSIFAFITYKPFVSFGIGSLFGTNANLVVNLTNSAPVAEVSWANLAQGGEERDGMLGDVIPQVRTLRPDYIRIDHVFDFYDVVSRDGSGNLQFSWTGLDRELKAITDSGAKPFVSISYMPHAISSGSEIDNPVNWDDWRKSVAALVSHISGTGGLNISNVYYEVWNEPDLFGKFSINGTKSYLTLYRHAALGAADARSVNAFKFGGPATTGMYPDWMSGLLNYTNANNLRLDFLSWHRYSRTIAVYDDDITAVKQVLVNYPQYKDIELIISEAGYNSDLDSGNDGQIAALHTMAMYASTFQKINKVFTFEIKDGPGEKQYWGRWGLLTNEKFGAPIPKSRYRAIEFLNRMRGDWYPVYGQGTWVKAVATTNNNVIRILLVNYDPAGLHNENVPISLVNLPSQTFTLRRTNFLGNSSDQPVTLTESNLSITEPMQPNSAKILEIIP
jgi:hypothetical protein